MTIQGENGVFYVCIMYYIGIIVMNECSFSVVLFHPGGCVPGIFQFHPDSLSLIRLLQLSDKLTCLSAVDLSMTGLLARKAYLESLSLNKSQPLIIIRQ